VKVLDGASHAVNLAHHVAMVRTYEKFGPAFELLLGPCGGMQDHAVNAAAISVKPL
jgi:hypothetical protein